MNIRLLFIVHRSAFIVFFALTCAKPAAPPRAVRRVVTLAPNITEIVFTIGGGSKIVGTDNFSDYPEAAKRLPKVGGVEPDVEKIVALHPDLVIASASGVHPNLRRALATVRIPLLVIRTERLNEIAPAMRAIGSAVGTDAAEAVSRFTAAVDQERRTRSKTPQVMFAVWPNPLYVAGRLTFADDLLKLAGAQNVVTATGWPQYSLEAFAAQPPEILLYPNRSVTAEAIDQLRGRSRAKIDAIAVDENVFTRPGPRVVLAAAMLNRILDQWERSH